MLKNLSCLYKIKEAAPSIQPDTKDQGGVQTKFWFWGADRMHKILKTKTPEPQAKEATNAEIISEGVSPETGIMQMIAENPTMGASTFFNLLKSQGYRFTKEADASSAFPQNLRAQESTKIALPIKCKFKESAASDNGIGPTRFKTVLIQEGMGNLKDAYFYSKEALKGAVPIFEGKKIYADHPSEFEEQNRPERSVRDVLGHFENIEFVENESGQAQLVGDVVILPDNDFRWARALMRHAVDYSNKYPDKEFVGLSINASGEAKELPIKNILEGNVSEPIKLKLEKALDSGIDMIRMVYQISEAVSCDLVTSAGAGGKVLQVLESNKEV